MPSRWVKTIVALSAFYACATQAYAQPSLAPEWAAQSEIFVRHIRDDRLVVSDQALAQRARQIAHMSGREKLQALYDAAVDAYVNSESERASEGLQALSDEADAHHDARYLAMAQILRAYAPALNGDYVAARHNLETALYGVEDPYVRAAGERLRSYVLTDLGLVGNALEAAQAGLRGLPIDSSTASLRAGLHDAMSYLSIHIGDNASAFEHLRRSMELDQSVGRPVDGFTGAYNIAGMLAEEQQRDASLRVTEMVSDIANAFGGPRERFFADMLCAKTHLAAAAYASAVQCADRARNNPSAPAEYMTRLLTYRASALARMGDGHAARRALNELRAFAANRGDPALQQKIRGIEPDVLRAEGDLAGAYAALRAFQETSQRDELRQFNDGVKELRASLQNEIDSAEQRAREQELKGALQKRSVEVMMLTTVLAVACLLATLGIALVIYRSRRAMIRAVCRAEEVLHGHAETKAAQPGVGISTARLATILDEIERRDDKLREAVEELKVARTAAEQANTAKSQFLATMSHELRTPLNAIIGYGEMVMENAVEEARKQDAVDAGKIVSAGKSLLGLINEVLDLSKVEAGRMTLSPEEFDVANLIAEAVSIVEPAAATNGNEINIEMSTDAGVAYSDAFRISQCLLNLLSNAAKFTKNGRIDVRVRREMREPGEMLVIDVADTGIGMTQEQMDNLFKPFVQADGSITRRFGGTGLGLAITRKISRLLGGDATVTSEPGRGSVFTIAVLTDIGRPADVANDDEEIDAPVLALSA